MFARTPHVRQSDLTDCGPAALATVALHHGLRLTVQQLRDLAGTDVVGTTLRGLREAAARLGFAARVVHGPPETLPLAPLPAIAHVLTESGQRHFVVVYRVTKTKVVVADPAAAGTRTWPREEFDRRWTGYLLLLTPERLASVEKGTPPWRRFLGLIAAHRGLLAEALACAGFLTVLGLATAFFLQHLIDGVLVRQDTRLLHAFGIGMVCVLLFKAMFSIVREFLLASLGRKIDLLLMAGFARHLLRLPISFFETRRVGEILSRIHDAEKIRDAIGGTTLSLIVDAVLVAAMMAVLWFYDMPLAAVTTAFVPVLVIAATLHLPAVRRTSREAMDRAAQLSAHLTEDVAGVETIRACGAEDARSDQAEARLVRLTASAFRLQTLGLSLSTMGMMITGAAGLAVLWYGGCRVIDGHLSVGELIFFYSLVGFLLGPLERLATANLRIQDALVAVDRLGQILDLPAESNPDTKRARFDGLKHGITLEAVTFRYGCRGNALEGVQLAIPAGSTVALVGESGSGKSTLLKLLTGFHGPTAGRITFDGTDLRDLDLATLREQCGVVSQEPFVFNGTVRENIAFGLPDAALNEVAAAARAAGLAEFIDGLPERYETMLGERGVNLSGGQRQRLAIARALHRRPSILLLDEATSHLDTATEQLIQENLRAVRGGRTVIVVAHRLSTIRDADWIHVLDHGRVVESGTHEELLARRGRYAALWDAQTGNTRRSGASRRVAGVDDFLLAQ